MLMIRPSDENEQSAAAGVGITAFETDNTTNKSTLSSAFPMLISRYPIRRI